MTNIRQITTSNFANMGSIQAKAEETYDVLILGAGLSGICSLYHIRERFPSWNVKALEAGGGVGGTWVGYLLTALHLMLITISVLEPLSRCSI
jgi:glycine/D-amino acid oxidase-like deaminating enzyme